MYFDPRRDLRPDPLRFNPINALIGPRPIGWITTLDLAGVANLAPFSYFNAFSADPPIVGFAPNARNAAGAPKDTLANLRQIPEFTASIVSLDLAEAMNVTSSSLPPGVSEYDAAGLHPAPSVAIRPPRVREAKASLECEVFDIIALPARPGDRASHLVLAAVVGIHIDDDLISNGRVDALALAQVARLGYFDYTAVTDIFELLRPD
jgi:flavin reductase (DIM6/NTAB) family NADH-FMN oxidoreductase RutF